MKGLKKERNPINVRNVEKHSVVSDIFKDMKVSILERSPMNVSNVGKPTQIRVPYEDT